MVALIKPLKEESDFYYSGRDGENGPIDLNSIFLQQYNNVIVKFDYFGVKGSDEDGRTVYSNVVDHGQSYYYNPLMGGINVLEAFSEAMAEEFRHEYANDFAATKDYKGPEYLTKISIRAYDDDQYCGQFSYTLFISKQDDDSKSVIAATSTDSAVTCDLLHGQDTSGDASYKLNAVVDIIEFYFDESRIHQDRFDHSGFYVANGALDDTMDMDIESLDDVEISGADIA